MPDSRKFVSFLLVPLYAHLYDEAMNIQRSLWWVFLYWFAIGLLGTCAAQFNLGLFLLAGWKLLELLR